MRAEFSQSSTISTAFSRVAAKFAGKIALSSPDGSLTYEQLELRSNQLALRLVGAGVKLGDRVGIAADPVNDTIVGLIGILKAGGGYVPLGRDLIPARLELIARDAGIGVIVGQLPDLEAARPEIRTVSVTNDAPASPQLLPTQDCDALAYVMYTSGSTGVPKGVMVPHRGIVRLVRGQDFLHFGPDERVLLHSPLSFDGSTIEIWSALLNGGTLVMPDENSQSLRGLGEIIAREKITLSSFTTGLFHAMADERPGDFAPLRQLIVGGDAISPVKSARVLQACPHLRLVNGYGPTENTTVTTAHTITREAADTGMALPIGKPIKGTEVFVLDENLNRVGQGEIGELCTSGLGLALGYLNRPELTAEKFVRAPWDAGLTLYRTGDMVRRDENGVYHFAGRIDTQVKIRGFRVELGAIETAMELFAGVTQAAVVAVSAGDNTDKRIVGFYCGGAAPDALSQFLATRLERHEMPSQLTALDALPLNANEKVDRRALEDMAKAVKRPRETRSVDGHIDAVLATQFAEVLGLEHVDADVNFFDLGASSLHVARVHERMQTLLDRSIDIADFFRFPTVTALAGHLTGKQKPQPRLRAATTATQRAGLGDIAIIGMAGRFPGARSVDEFWQALVEGRELISHFSEEELDIQPPPGADRSQSVLARGVMPDPDLFDARHFGIPPREAERMDPQHRILLEIAQTALDNAGIDPERFAGRIGIFAGSSQNSYLLNNLLSSPAAARTYAAGYPLQDFVTTIGNDKDFIVTRIAYKLNLGGPAIAVLSACSTSLVAVAQACDALRSGAADAVLAGGVSVTFPSKRPYQYLPDGMASDDGHCRTFDARATGTVFGDGAGMVVLRRLEDALADGDEIIASIRGHAVNNDGSDKIGYAAPSAAAQADVIRSALANANVRPDEVGYVEAHGTGTPLGDPIEFSALREVFDGSSGHTALGSAKTYVGHLDVASGITGLIKTALTLKHGVIPPLLHFNTPNPRIKFDGSPFYPVTELTEWKAGDTRRIAGVSAFGVGGTNAHIVLEEAPSTDQRQPLTAATGPRVLPVSASSREALKDALQQLGQWAGENRGADIDAVADALRFGRKQYGERAVIIADDMADLAMQTASASVKHVTTRRPDRAAFLFPGQGAQHVGMGRDLYKTEAVFREALDRCAAILTPELGFDIRDVLYGDALSPDEAAAQLRDTALAQPAIFAVSYALAQQWQHWGVKPDTLIGHSVGEFVAATLSGIMSLADALKLVALRGRLISALPRGTMISVRASEVELQPFLGGGLDLAAVNGAKACVMAAPDEAIAAIVPQLEAAGFVVARLQTSHAFHSAMMDPVLPAFREAVAKTKLNAPRVPILSTVTGAWLKEAEATDPEYWVGHMRKPVRFYDAVQQMWADGAHVLIETGPGRNLTMLAAQNPDMKSPVAAISSLPHAQATMTDSSRSMREAFGLLWAHGYPVDWSHIDPHAGLRKRASGLPAYPYQRKRFWVEPAAAPASTIVDDQAAQADGTTAFPAPQAEAAPAISAIDALRALLSELSGVEPADMPAEAGFVELGFDSLLLTQVTRELSDRFGVKVALRQLVEGFDTIGALAAHIEATGNLNAQKTKAAPVPVNRNEGAFDEAAAAAPMASSAPMTSLSRDVQEITAEQRAHIEALTARFTAKTAKSKALTTHYRPFHADPRTASGFNRLWKEIVYQIVTVKSKGSRLIDVDGNEYIDLLNGFGPGFLGHSPDQVVRAVESQLHDGFEIGPQSLAAMEAAELFCEVTGNDRASFVCTGSEAVYAVMRLARTVTGRDRIVMFARDYHGNFDEVLVRGVDAKDGPRSIPIAPGIPRDSVKNVVVLPYGTPQSLEWIRANADTLAAVIIEPVQSRRPEFRPVEFIREVRRITENSGTVFVLDEVITGFRFGPRGAQEYYGVKADLVTYGKVAGGGMPIGVVSGKARFMDTFDGGQWEYGDDSFPSAPVTFFAGTFVRHPLAMASLKAMLTFFKSQPDFFWKTVNAKGDRLAKTVDRWFLDNDMPFQLPNCGSLMFLRTGDDQKFGPLIGAHLRDRGVFLLEGFPSYITAAHDDQDIEYVIDAFKDSALEMRAANLIPGRAEPGYSGPRLSAVPPRLALTGGETRIAEAMARTETTIAVPTTEAQREIWAAMMITPEVAPAYNESVSLKMHDAINADALIEAVKRGLARHDALRSTFSSDGMEMIVHATMPVPFEMIDLSDLSPQDRAAHLAAIIDDEMERRFDITKGPFVRARLITFGPQENHLIITAHHIVCDGWSIDVVIRDIGRIYTALSEGREPELGAPLSIIDYSRAEQEWVRTDESAKARAYWLSRFEGVLPVLDLPTDHPRPAVKTVRGGRVDHVLPAALTERVRKLSRANGATFVNIMLAAYKLFIADLANTSDIVIGLPASGQAARGMPTVVGHCVNLLPIRTRIDREKGFSDFLKTVRRTMLDAFDHQTFTYGELIRELRAPRDPGRIMLVPVVFNIDNGIDLTALSFGKVKTDLVTNPRHYEHFELYLNLTDSPEAVRAEWSYNADIFDRETIEAYIAAFVAMLDHICDDPERPLSGLHVTIPEKRSEPVPPPPTMPTMPTLADIALPNAQAPWDTTISIDPGPGTGTLPLFIACGADGTVRNLREMGQTIGRRRPVIGLQTRGVLGHDPHETVEAAATEHLHYMRKRQPKGPYLLAGYSSGSYVALEIARQLEEAGEKVAFLGILDIEAPGFHLDSNAAFVQRLKLEWSIMRTHGVLGFARRLSSARSHKNDTVEPEPTLHDGDPQSRNDAQMHRIWLNVASRYRPQPFKGDAWILLGEPEGYRAAQLRASDPHLGWDGFIQGEIHFEHSRFGHSSMMKGKAARQLADSIIQAIERKLKT